MEKILERENDFRHSLFTHAGREPRDLAKCLTTCGDPPTTVDCPITASYDPRPIASTELRLPRASKGATEIYLCPRPSAHAATRATAALANQPVPNISLRCHARRYVFIPEYLPYNLQALSRLHTISSQL